MSYMTFFTLKIQIVLSFRVCNEAVEYTYVYRVLNIYLIQDFIFKWEFAYQQASQAWLNNFIFGTKLLTSSWHCLIKNGDKKIVLGFRFDVFGRSVRHPRMNRSRNLLTFFINRIYTHELMYIFFLRQRPFSMYIYIIYTCICCIAFQYNKTSQLD